MKIKNKYTSHLGFGSMRLLPEEAIETNQLPKGYDENHPLIKFYINQGWLEVVAGKLKTTENSESNDGSRAKTDEDDKSNDGSGDRGDNQSKPLSRMNKAELQALAVELKLEFAPDDSNSELIEKIKAAQKDEE